MTIGILKALGVPGHEGIFSPFIGLLYTFPAICLSKLTPFLINRFDFGEGEPDMVILGICNSPHPIFFEDDGYIRQTAVF